MSENIGLGLAGLGSGYSAAGSVQAGKYAREVGAYNEAAANLQANDVLVRGAEGVRRQRAGVRQLIGAERASMAAQGQDLEDGSAADVQADAAYLGELDAITISQNAAREAWGYRVAGQNERIRGQIGYAEGTTRAVGTILSTAGSLALTKYGMTRGGSRGRY